MKQARLLRGALAGNAIFSVVSGAVLIFAPGWLSETLRWTGPDLWWLLGGGLWGFAAELLWQASRSRPIPVHVLLSSLGDFLWVLGTLGLALAVPALMSPAGWLSAATVAAVVLLFGLLQLIGLDRLYRGEDGDYALTVTVPVGAPAGRFWPILADLGGIKAYAASLADSFLIGGGEPRVGARRECADRSGKRWREVVTDWRPGEGFDLRFESEAPDFPFPFARMSGGWRLSTNGKGSLVSVFWRLRPLRAWSAPLLLPLMEPKVTKDVTRLVRRMDEAALAQD